MEISLKKNAELFETKPWSRFDELVEMVEKVNPDFAKASMESSARIECKVNTNDVEANMVKKGKTVFMYHHLKVRVLSKGTKASLILNLGVVTQLCITPQKEIGWCDYKFDETQFKHVVKSSNCEGMDEADLLDFFFTCISKMQFYPFDEEIKALMDYFFEAQDKIKTAFEMITYVAPEPELEPESEIETLRSEEFLNDTDLDEEAIDESIPDQNAANTNESVQTSELKSQDMDDVDQDDPDLLDLIA